MEAEYFLSVHVGAPDEVRSRSVINRLAVATRDHRFGKDALAEVHPRKPHRFSVRRADDFDVERWGDIQRSDDRWAVRRASVTAVFPPAVRVVTRALPQMLPRIPDVVGGIGVENLREFGRHSCGFELRRF